MRKVVLYIAMSLDGFIAGRDDDVSWLNAYQAAGEDYGYARFLGSVDTAVMGARTYTESLRHPDRLLPQLKTYVLSQHPLPPAPKGEVEFWNGMPGDLLASLRQGSGRDIYLVGGGQVVASFLKEGLIDEALLFVAPALLGEGLPLFAGQKIEFPLKLAETVPYPSGMVQLHYRK